MAKYNKTQLELARATERNIVHRDYMAHALRWTHIVKNSKMDMKVLDVGCGTDVPLCWTMYSNKFRPKLYVGLDIRKDCRVDMSTFPFEAHFVSNFDVTKVESFEEPITTRFKTPVGNLIMPGPYDIKWDLAVCLEVIEHMDKGDGLKLLDNLAMLNTDKLFLSTPCFNGSKAANHIYEWRYDELKEELLQRFNILAHYGTFASQRDVKPFLNNSELELFERLRAYYDSHFLSTVFAPLYPHASRNVIWRLKPHE